MKSGLFGTFKMNKPKEEQGIWVEYPVNADGSIPRFRIGRLAPHNVAYQKSLESVQRGFEKQIELGRLDKATDLKLGRKAFIEALLLEWENVLQEDGEQLPLTPANALALFEALPDLYTDLTAKARNAALFMDDDKEGSAGN